MKWRDRVTQLLHLQDGDNLILRQSGALASGERQHIYAADMRREVSLQFYPDGFEWLDSDPVPLSLGYSSHAVCAFSLLSRSAISPGVIIRRSEDNHAGSSSSVCC